MRVRVKYTLHNSRDGLVKREDAIAEHLNVELMSYVDAGTEGEWIGDDETGMGGYIKCDDGNESYVPFEYCEVI